MNSTKLKIVRNTIANIAMRVWSLGLSFVLFPYIVYHVGKVSYGVWALTGSIAGYFSILDFGMSYSMVKYVSEYNAKRDIRSLNSVFNSAFFFYLCVGMIVAASLFLIGTFGIKKFKIPTYELSLAKGIVYLSAASALLGWPTRALSGVILGMQRYDITAKISFASSTINAIFTVAILSSGFGILELIFSQIMIGCGTAIITVILAKRLVPSISIGRKFVKASTLKRVVRFSGAMFTIQVAGIIILNTDQILLGMFVGAASITLYMVGRKLVMLCNHINNLLGGALLPAAAELEATSNEASLKKLILRGGKYRCGATLGVLIVIFVMCRDIIYYWMGAEYVYLTTITRIFLSYWFLVATMGTLGFVIRAKEYLKPVVIVNVLIAVLNLGISLALVRPYGMLGIILGTVISYFVVYAFWMPYCLKLLGIKISEYARNTLLPAYLPMFLVGTALYMLSYTYPSQNFFMALTYVSGGLILYFCIFYLISMSASERKDLNRTIKAIIHAD